MTGEQIQAAREAAQIVVAFGPMDDDGNVSPSYVACERFLWLTDPTPLTWELVVAEGFSQIEGAPKGAVSCRCGDAVVSCRPRHSGVHSLWPWEASWDIDVDGCTNIIRPAPRTPGELRQLMIRVGGETR